MVRSLDDLIAALTPSQRRMVRRRAAVLIAEQRAAQQSSLEPNAGRLKRAPKPRRSR